MAIFAFKKISRAVFTGMLSLSLGFQSLSVYADNQSFDFRHDHAHLDLPDLGTAAVNTFSLEKENQVGDAMMRVVRASSPIIHDPVLGQYLTELGNKLVAHAPDVKTPFYFFLVNDNEINAFAFFGGHVGIHSGLFLNADNESELASVLAHEIIHVTQRHLARSFEAQSKQGPVAVAGMLGAILLAIAAPQAGFAALATTQALSAQSQINYTRLHEKEADRIGMQVMVDAGFNPNSAADFFGKLAARYRFTTKPPQMLITHPLPESRISEARNRALLYPMRPLRDNLDYQLAKARIQARYSTMNGNSALNFFESQLAKGDYTFQQAAAYGKSLALYELERFAEAETIIDQLLSDDPHHVFYLDLKTDLLLEKKAYDQVIELLLAQKRLKPTSAVLNINLANVYNQAGQAEKAVPLLEEMIFLDKKNPLPYQLLTESYQRLGNRSMEHFVKAEQYALVANYPKAIDELNFAYREADNNSLQKARIDARIKQFKRAKQALEDLK